MTNSGKLSSNELTNWLIDKAGFRQSKCQMSVYYKYAPGGSKLVVLSYVDYYVYCYMSEYLGKWFVETLGNILYVNFLGYPYLFMYIMISKHKDHSISLDQSIYATYFVVDYLDTATIK